MMILWERSPNHLNFCRPAGPRASDFLSARPKSCRPEKFSIKSRYNRNTTSVSQHCHWPSGRIALKPFVVKPKSDWPAPNMEH